MVVGCWGRRRSQWSWAELVGLKVGVWGSPIECSAVELQKSMRGWWCEILRGDGVACRSPTMMIAVSGCLIVSSSVS